MPEAADPIGRAARLRVVQCAAAATVVAAAAVFVAIGTTMSAGADSGAGSSPRASARHHTADRRIIAASTPTAPTSTTPSSRPAGPRTPVDNTDISSLAASGIPEVALNAYRVASARMAHAQPSCGISWYLIAGIGRVESDHGQFAGSVLHRDGLSTPRIIGPALNGKGNKLIKAPANGMALDGDAKYAHALGPMQFIPSTWAGWGADANGDGKADIFNINDAALGAARYLCAAGGNLRTPSGQSTAVLAYNHLTSYRDEVLALADAYRRGITPTGPLVGDTTGSLPKTGHSGALPPATAGTPVTSHPGHSSGSTHPSPPTSTSPRPDPRLRLSAVADRSVATAAQKVRYSLTVTNSGNVSISGLSVDLHTADGHAGARCATGSLRANASRTCTVDHQVSQADINQTQIVTTATATATAAGRSVTAAVDPPRVDVADLHITSGSTDPVDPTTKQVNFSIRARNDGHVTLNDLQVKAVDPDDANTLRSTSFTCTPSTGLRATALASCTGSYQAQSDDVDNGSVLFVVLATASDSIPVRSN